MVVQRVRVETTYPCPPDALVAALVRLVTPLPTFDRVAVGFPGMVRNGRTLSASDFATVAGPGSKVSPQLSVAWERFDLARALEAAFDRPTRVVNHDDLQGAAVVTGQGLELVVTLGIGFGTAVFVDGRLFPHLDVSHHPFRHGETYDEALGEEGRRRVGTTKWSQRVRQALQRLDALLSYDTVYVGGGNSARVTADLGPKATLVDNSAGILGGIKIWDCPEPLLDRSDNPVPYPPGRWGPQQRRPACAPRVRESRRCDSARTGPEHEIGTAMTLSDQTGDTLRDRGAGHL